MRPNVLDANMCYMIIYVLACVLLKVPIEQCNIRVASEYHPIINLRSIT